MSAVGLRDDSWSPDTSGARQGDRRVPEVQAGSRCHNLSNADRDPQKYGLTYDLRRNRFAAQLPGNRDVGTVVGQE